MRLSITKSLAAMSALAVLAGCASVGNERIRAETEISVGHKIEEGSTSKRSIKTMFGSPYNIVFTDGGLEVWTYEFSNISVDSQSFIPIVNFFGSSASGLKKQLVVMFDEKGIVKRYAMSESEVAQKTGVFNH